MKISRNLLSIIIFSSLFTGAFSQPLTIARVKYHGGGDWYNDPSCIPNLCSFIRQNTNIDVSLKEEQVALTDLELFSYAFLYLTGHGMISFSDQEAANLRSYLLNGGFLYADDDYGMDKSFRQAMHKVFPDRKLLELPFSHGIYSIQFKFPNGLPKIHEHNGMSPQGFAIFDDSGRIMVYYTFETNISDGWADPGVHNDPPDKRLAALKMGTNIVVWALLH
ncbi:DUF4159 domain-containing protein [bacterium]|nr:DUF4159 domain-containing protein [bacterium]